MKKILCALTALLLLFCAACAETSIIEKPEIIIELITPTPNPAPVGESYSSEDMIVILPAGMHILDENECAGYDAAISFDYPSGGEPFLMSASEDGNSVLSFILLESAQDAASAAREAALAIPFASVKETHLGENSFSALSCTINEDAFQLYFISDGSRLLCVGASGIEEEDLNTMLTGLIF